MACHQTSNGDWKNCVVLHGSKKEIETGVGEFIGVQCKNKFQALSSGSSGEGKVDVVVR